MAVRPNILFITTDQMRSDCLGMTSNGVVETPNLDHLASNGMLFSKAYSATPTCIPARAAILTGMEQRHHGRVGYRDNIPWDYEHTLPGELAKVGYHTQGVGKMHFYPPRSLQGFHNVVLHDGYMHAHRGSGKAYELYDDYVPWLRQQADASVDYWEHGLNCNSWVARPWPFPERLHPTNWAVHQSVEFIRRRDPEKPFFLWLSFVRPHAPLDPPAYYFDEYMRRDLPLPPIGDWVDPNVPTNPGLAPDADYGQLSERELKRARAGYYGSITHIDHQVGRMIDTLIEYGLYDNTFIVFTSDHGELLGDHHRWRKSLPYEGSTHVPLFVKPHRNYKGQKSGVNHEVVELRDIFPTILDAAGCDIPDTVDGKSLLPFVRGETPQWREYLHGEHSQGGMSNHWLTDGKEKYIWFSQTGREQLFDLQSDPHECHDLASDAKASGRLTHWRQLLVQELDGREEGYVKNGKLVVGREPQTFLKSVIENKGVVN